MAPPQPPSAPRARPWLFLALLVAVVFAAGIALFLPGPLQRTTARLHGTRTTSAIPAPTTVATPIPWPLPPGVVEPTLVEQVRPIYPGTTRRHPWGVVLLDVLVTTEGAVKDIRVVKSDDPLLQEAAITAVKQWRYQPAQRGGQPVSVRLPISISVHPL